MSHAIPFALKGENVQATTAPIAPASQPVPLAPAATAAPAASTLKPPFARKAGAEWSWSEVRLAEQSYRTAGLDAAYRAIPHRSRPAVRGRLQRAGLIPKRITVTP